MKKKIVFQTCKLITVLAKKVAEQEANSACAFFSYQEKEPDQVKKLRKF